MLELGFIRENRDEIIERMAVRNLSAEKLIDKAIESDKVRRSVQKEMDDLQAELNQISKSSRKNFKRNLSIVRMKFFTLMIYTKNMLRNFIKKNIKIQIKN